MLAGGWHERLGIARPDVGVGMTSAEVDVLSARIDLAALRGYWDAVARGTGEVAGGFAPAELEVVVDPARVRAVLRDEGALLPAGAWVVDVWADHRSRGWFLLQAALLHPYGHLFDCLTVRGLVGS